MEHDGGQKERIVVLDRDTATLQQIRSIVEDRFEISTFTTAEELKRYLSASPSVDLLLMDWHITEDELRENAGSVLARIRISRPSLPLILLAHSTDKKEVNVAARIGATHVILKPFENSDLAFWIDRCLGHLSTTVAGPEATEIPLDENTSFVRCSQRMREIESHCALVARADIPVLILGESGTGKEVVAKLIHKMSARSERCFLKVNCAAMPADLLESELFGYEQGAFTGAIKSKPGKFEICNSGTIFLDEIGEMPALLQAKLLQVLQDGSFARLGARSSTSVDVRVIAATNIDIKAAIAQRTFREDLYYRLNGFTFRMPRLCDRAEEIPILSHHFMRKVSRKYGTKPLPISSRLMQALTQYSWPGNLRELENIIKRYLVLGNEQSIIEELLPSPIGNPHSASAAEVENGNLKRLVRHLKGHAESLAIAQSLETTGWNRKAAASDLQISYKALLYKIKQYNLTPKPKRSEMNGHPPPLNSLPSKTAKAFPDSMFNERA